MHKNQLDGLRFFAFFLVFLSHIPGEPLPLFLGQKGLQLFFALSGFLITRLLLVNRTGRLLHDLRIFYVRRFLRIFPLYYAVLIFYILAGSRAGMLSYFTYTYNINVWLVDDWIGDAGHFWSLCIEEQFYISVPFILLLAPNRLQPVFLGAMILLSGFAGPTLDAWFPRKTITGYFLLPVCGQYLMWGCMAGYVEVNTKARPALAFCLFFVGLLLQGMVVVEESYRVMITWPSEVPFDLMTTVSGASFAAIVFGLWRTENALLLKAFSFPGLAYLGKISYGLYVYHILALWSIAPAFLVIVPSWCVDSVSSTLTVALLGFIVTIALSVISWHWFESPLNNYKDLFPYGRHNKATAFQGSSHTIESSLPSVAQQVSRNHKAKRFVLQFTLMMLSLFVLAISFQVAFKGLSWPRSAIGTLVHTVIPRK